MDASTHVSRSRSLADRMLLYANIGVIWPLTCSGLGAVAGLLGVFVLPALGDGHSWSDLTELLPISVFYGSAAGAGVGVVVGLAVSVMTRPRRVPIPDLAAYVRAVRIVGTAVAALLFAAAAAAFNDGLSEQGSFLLLYTLPMGVGMWMGWQAVPTIVTTYEHRLH